MAVFDGDAHVRGEPAVIVLVLKQLWRLFGPDISGLRSAERAGEKIESFIADRPTTPQLPKALIEILVALAKAEKPTEPT